MLRPHGRVVLDALNVVPHAVAIDESGSRGLGNLEHPAVDMGRNPGKHRLRGCAQAFWPLFANQVVVAADAAAGDDDSARAVLEIGYEVPIAWCPALGVIRGEDGAADPDHSTAFDDELIRAATESEGDESGADASPHLANERLEDAGSGAPHDVEAGNRIAVAVGRVSAALRPADHREELDAECAKPLALLCGGKLEVRLRPLLRPVVFIAVEAGASEPVLAGESRTVLDTHTALLRRIDEKKSAERPPGLATETGLWLLVDDRDMLASIHELRGGDQASDTRTDDDRSALLGCVLGFLLRCLLG